MARLIGRRSRKAGLPPATLIPPSDVRAEDVRVTVIDYDESNLTERAVKDLKDVLPFKESPTVTWLNIDGLGDVTILEWVGQTFGVHPLVLEDILSTDQRPKIEDYGDYNYIVLRMVSLENGEKGIASEQVSLILGRNFVISFQERVGDVFDPIRQRIREGKGRIRKMGADYLVYILMDAIVDNYFVFLENLGDRIERMEDDVVSNPTPDVLRSVHRAKRELIFLRKSTWPLREVIGTMERGESPLLTEATSVFLRDLYDHTIQVIDTVETSRDMVSGMLDIYLSVVSNKMNEIMKVLTIIATIFIPLTFIAGIYGMNFVNMPELAWKWGYFVVLLAMLAVGIVMTIYFRSKQWL